MFRLLRVRDYRGADWRKPEIEFLGIANDSNAVGRFDDEFKKELGRVGVKTANALSVRAGLAYDTAADVMRVPHKMSRRLFWVIANNVGDFDMERVEGLAVGVADLEAYKDEYELAKLQAWLLVDSFLLLDKQAQFMVRRMVEATKPKGGYPQGDATHVAACKRLQDQLQLIIGLHSDDD